METLTEKKAAAEEGSAGKGTLDNPAAVDYSSLSEQLSELGETDLTVVGTLAGGSAWSDELIRKTGLPAGDVLAAVTMLSLRGYVQGENGQVLFAITETDQKK